MRTLVGTGDYMTAARDLSGQHIGTIIQYKHRGNWRTTEELTMVTHRKDGQVYLRWGKQNRQIFLRGNTEVIV